MSKVTRLLADPPKGRNDNELRDGGGFWWRLLHDDRGADKLEDRHPFNTFVEILLAVIAVAVSVSAILQGILAYRELSGGP